MSWDVSDFKKVDAACKAFACKPYYAIVVDSSDWIRLFVTPLKTLKAVAKLSDDRVDRRMTPSYLAKYMDIPEIKRVELRWSESHWWSEPSAT